MYKNYGPLFNVFTLISVNVDESEDMKSHNTDEMN